MTDLDILLFKEQGQWLSQCLQHDVCEQGNDIPEVLENLKLVLTAHIEEDVDAGQTPLSDIPEAPKFLRERWLLATPLVKSQVQPQNSCYNWMAVRIVPADLKL